jgi:polysaccharide biosynthesis protein PslJ
MSTIHQAPLRREWPVALAVIGVVALAVAIPLGPRAIGLGLGAMVILLLVAFFESSKSLFSWPNAVGFLLLVVWFVPIKGYALPVELPFNLEHYRVAIILLLFALLVSVAARRSRLSFAGRGVAVASLAALALISQSLNFAAVDAGAGIPGTAIKSLSYFLAYLIVYMIVCSVLESRAAIDTVIRFLVGGGTAVAFASLYEARFGFNVFDHLHEWLPGFERQFRAVLEERGGQVRVISSAQHPIALGVALTLVIPFAFYLAGQARSVARSRMWLGAACLLAVGAAATISRTTIAMAIVMLIAMLTLRGKRVLRYWPVLLLVPFVIHFAAPGSLGGLYKQFFPREGLISDLNGRAGQGGSGRLADVGPAFTLWSRQPVIGQGLGNEFPTTEDTDRFPGKAPPPIIFDNQYLDTLVKLGGLGLAAVIVFFWGGAIGLFRRARSMTGPTADLLAAASIAAFGFAASMLFFDAFAFVQATLVCVVIIALGYRAAELARQTEESAELPLEGGVR